MFKEITNIDKMPNNITHFNTALRCEKSFFFVAEYIFTEKYIRGATINIRQYKQA